MRRWLLVGALFCMVGLAAGQDVPKAEIFTGYSYGNFKVLSNRSSLDGWNASATVNIYRWFGLTTDFGGLYRASGSETLALPSGITETVSQRFHTFLFGPQISYRRGNLSAFAHILVGEALVSEHIQTIGCNGTCATSLSSRPSYGAAVPGGGLDYSFRRNLAWRIQADYLPIGATNDVRISTGLVFRIGKQ
ncbi:MAG TPA: hypothetical protein VED66_05320 [Candidatus Sulfotelmatobacter sp.]|nr:hypothetical protein [Candidatus Sulfotelmatobacter sp.]